MHPYFITSIIKCAQNVVLRRAHRLSTGVKRCATVEAQTTQYVGVPQYPPTIPAEVQVLRTDPTRPFVRLGEILIDASIEPAPPMAEIELKLQDEGAKLGADAVVVVYDKIATVGAYVSGPVWARDVNTIQGRKLKAIAIKYK